MNTGGYSVNTGGYSEDIVPTMPRSPGGNTYFLLGAIREYTRRAHCVKYSGQGVFTRQHELGRQSECQRHGERVQLSPFDRLDFH